MDYLPLKYYLLEEDSIERTLYVRIYRLIDDDDKIDRILEILNIPFFIDENNLKNLIKNEDIKINFINLKSTEKLKTKTALIEFKTKKDLKTELRLIKYSDDEKLIMFKKKDDFKKVTTKNCGKNLLSKRFTHYITDIDETRDKVMEIMNNYNDEILVAQKRKKRRYELQDDGWTKVIRK